MKIPTQCSFLAAALPGRHMVLHVLGGFFSENTFSIQELRNVGRIDWLIRGGL